MKIGLLFGSFNPIHIGHTALANYIVEYSDLEQIWFVVSPQNPFKTSEGLLPEEHRLNMVELAIGNDNRFKSCAVEFQMPKPSFTIDTLTLLSDKYPENEFVVLMGGDNIQHIERWKDYKNLLKTYEIWVYMRPGYTFASEYTNVKKIEAPLLDISSTFIRDSYCSGSDVRHFLKADVHQYIEENKLLLTQ